MFPDNLRFFLSNKNKTKLFIKPDTILFNNKLYVIYDCLVNGQIIIPKGSTVIGDWITENDPPSAQLQLTKIFINGVEYPISAFSLVFEKIIYGNSLEGEKKTFLYKKNNKSSLLYNTSYLEIPIEISVIIKN